MNQSSEVSFMNLLSKMMAKTRYEKERDLTTSPPSVVVTTNTSKVMPAKAKSAGSLGANSSSLLLGKNSTQGTNTHLAKLLSTNNGNSVSRSLEESAMYNHKAANNSDLSEKNLSLANLLASSKVCFFNFYVCK